MIHVVAHAALTVAESDSGLNSRDWVVAIIGGISLVLAASVTALAARPRRRDDTPAVNSDDELIRSLVADLTSERDGSAAELARIRIQLAVLREACRVHGLDPDKIIKGDP